MHITFIASPKKILCAGVNHGLVHSEVDALRTFRTMRLEKKEGQKYFFINIRMTLYGFSGISRPCRHCALFVLRNSDLFDTLFFTDEKGEWEECTLTDCTIHMFDHISFGHKSLEERKYRTKVTNRIKRNRKANKNHHQK